MGRAVRVAGAMLALLFCAASANVGCAQDVPPYRAHQSPMAPWTAAPTGPPPAPHSAAAFHAAATPLTPSAPPTPDTLESAWAIAVATDATLEAERWRALAAQDRRHAANAERWPSLIVDNSYHLLSDEPAFQFANPTMPFAPLVVPNTQREYYALDAVAVLPVYTSGRITNSVHAAAAEAHAVDWEAEAARADLKLIVAEEYLAVLRAQRDLEVAASQLASLQGHGQDVETFCRYGRCQQNELLAARVALSQAEQEQIRAQTRLDVARCGFNRRLGRWLDEPVVLSELPAASGLPDLESLTARALGQRAELQVLCAKLQAFEHQAACRRAQARPQVELHGGYSFQENQFAQPQGIASLGAVVSWQALDGGKQRYLAEAAQHEAEAVRRRLWDLESRIRYDVRRGCLEVQETTRRMAVMQTVIERAEENLRVTRDRFANGVGTNTAVLEAEALRAQSYRDHFHARYDTILATLRLQHAVGDL